MWWWSLDTEQLRLINRRKKMWPAGTTLHAKDNLLIRENSLHFVHFLKLQNELASIVFVLSTMPRKVKHVVGPLTFSVFTGALIRLQSDYIWDKFWWHTLEFAQPAVKISSRWCSKWWTLYWCCSNQWMVSASWLNMNGADRSPKGKHVLM